MRHWWMTGLAVLVMLTLPQAAAGASWKVQRLAGAPSPDISTVSCASARICTAVGDETIPAPNGIGTMVTLAEIWKNGRWSVQKTPRIANSLSSDLYGVSCESATTCTAVGDYTNSSGDQVPLMEGWDGSSWSVQSAPSATGVLDAVSCSSPSTCTAVGDLAATWDGKSWSTQTIPQAAGTRFGGLQGVSCASANSCMAVGTYVKRGGAERGLAERWDGGSWSVESIPTPVGARKISFHDVSCGSMSSCIAVGTFKASTSRADVPVVDRWNGHSWSLQNSPNPFARGSELDGVSCFSAKRCIAVGSGATRTAGVLFAERWNGRQWSVQRLPDPPHAARAALTSVSCVSGSVCTAVGDGITGSGANLIFAERYM